AYHTNTTTGIIAHAFHSFLNSPAYLDQMLFNIVDPVIIFHCKLSVFVFYQLIYSSQSVFYNKQRFLIAVIKLVQHDPQAYGIDLPSPLAGFQIRIGNTSNEISRSEERRVGKECSSRM